MRLDLNTHTRNSVESLRISLARFNSVEQDNQPRLLLALVVAVGRKEDSKGRKARGK